MSTRDIWVHFACAAIPNGTAYNANTLTHDVSAACQIADSMLIEYEKRYGDKALIIDGIKTCFACSKPITGEFVVSDGKDGEYKKFCAECIEKHKKGEEISNPGIAICVKCGQQKGTIFKCPEGPQPRQLTEELASTLTEYEIELFVKAEQEYRNKLTAGPEHVF